MKIEGLGPARPSVTEPTSQEQPAAAEPDSAALEASLNLRPDDRKVVQQALSALAFDTRGADGVFGANTRRAIISWQRAKGDEPTGYLTASQYGRLLAEAEPKLAALESARQEPEQGSRLEPAVGVFEAPRRDQTIDESRDCNDCPLMLVVPAGSFMMGSPDSEEGRDGDEGPQHRVTITKPFAVGKYEVTFDEWDACVAVGGCKAYRPDDKGWGRRRQPVINVSWDDAQTYVAWLKRATGNSYRLLTEAEWEYVARAGTTTRYWWGDEITAGKANYSGSGFSRTIEIGSYAPNRWGLHDVHGNVQEWVEDCRNDNYREAPHDGSARGGNCLVRVIRGGSWNDKPIYVRSADRGKFYPNSRLSYLGFRVARTLTP